MRGNTDRIPPIEGPRNILTGPHIMYLKAPAACQPGNVGKRECLGRCVVRGIDDEDMCTLFRSTGIVLGGRSDRSVGRRSEWLSWGAMYTVLVESKKFRILDNGKLSRGKSAQIGSQQDGTLQKNPCREMGALFLQSECPIPDFHHVHVIMPEELDGAQMCDVGGDEADDRGPRRVDVSSYPP